MTCAKTRVRVTLTQPDGRSWTGENRCRNPQAVCPRAPGEDYTKCRTVCDQVGHAELDALAVAGDGARGSTASLEGHTYYCMDCQHALFKAGVVALRGPGARDTGLGDTPLQNGQTMAELAEIEREHFGDPDKGTGIYAAGVGGPAK